METKHTPGAWACVRSKTEKHKTAIFILNKESKLFIGKVYGHEGQPVVANSKLFASAPKLLQALVRLEEEIRVRDVIDPQCASMRKAREAIAEATGSKE